MSATPGTRTLLEHPYRGHGTAWPARWPGQDRRRVIARAMSCSWR
ncbi:hypothetical protein SUDANB140_00358 [Streptomyces sp. enrichment culture]